MMLCGIALTATHRLLGQYISVRAVFTYDALVVLTITHGSNLLFVWVHMDIGSAGFVFACL